MAETKKKAVPKEKFQEEWKQEAGPIKEEKEAEQEAEETLEQLFEKLDDVARHRWRNRSGCTRGEWRC